MRRVFIAALAVSLAACGSTTVQGKATTPTTTAPTVTATTTAPDTTAPSAGIQAPRPSALDQLSGFVTASRALDSRLRAAAQAINGSGPPWPVISPAVAAVVSAADPDPVTAAVPAGLPQELLQQTVLVYSDLMSRRMAMRYFGSAGPVADQQWLLDGLANGSAAAARFPGDLARLVTLAGAAPAVTVAAPTSIQAAERDLLVQYVGMANAGCGSTGGQIFPSLPAITWTSPTSGRIAGIDFTATPTAIAWNVVIMAC